jgi:hypothetical protein
MQSFVYYDPQLIPAQIEEFILLCKSLERREKKTSSLSYRSHRSSVRYFVIALSRQPGKCILTQNIILLINKKSLKDSIRTHNDMRTW